MRFRLLVHAPGEGARNMAVDEALLVTALESRIATVRLYGFDPPTVSLGYRQRARDAIDVEACRALGVDWVRRPTGGRALLHQDEVTYCVAAPFEGVFREHSVRAVYHRVSAAIRGALAGLGVPLDRLPPDGAREAEPSLDVPCLASPTLHEIASGGRKLVASSQRRRGRAFLQHGSVLRRFDPGLWEKVRPKSSRTAPLAAIGVEDLSPAPVSRSALVAALCSGFEEAFGPLEPVKEMTPEETSRVSELREAYRRESAWGIGPSD